MTLPSVAFLDANAIWSAPVRDTLLRAAEDALYLPLWSHQILEEMAHSLKRERPDLSPEGIDRTVSLMLSSFPDALVSGFEHLIPLMQNAPEDRHVLAAAVHGGAQIIVTWNRADFPPASLQPYGITIQTPDEFLCRLCHESPLLLLQILRQQAAALRLAPKTLDELLATLQRTVPQFVALVRTAEPQ